MSDFASRRYQDDEYAAYYADQRWTATRHARATHRWETAAIAALLDRIGMTAGAPAERIVDLPCGAGRMRVLLGARCRRLIQADLAAAMLRRRAHSEDWCLQASALCIPLADECLDLAFCLRVVHHFAHREERVRLLGELGRVSRRWVLASFFDAHSLPVLRDRLRRRQRILTPQSPAGFRAEAAAAGLRVVAIRHRRRLLSKQVLVLLEKHS